MLNESIPSSQALHDYFLAAKEWALSYIESTEYTTRCLAFVEDAYEQANGVEIFGGSTATESAIEYQASRKEEEPAVGAFVFFSCAGTIRDEYKDWGHVGLYLGEGKVIHAWDKVRVNSIEEIENLSSPAGWTKLEYVGWVPPERIFLGYRNSR